MAYATVFHVAGLNPARPITGTSLPSATNVVQYIDECAGVIDAKLSGIGYVTPISPTAAPSSALMLLQQVNAVGAAYMVESSAQTSAKLDQFKKMWDEALLMLATSSLPGVDKLGASGVPRQSIPAASAFFSMDMEL